MGLVASLCTKCSEGGGLEPRAAFLAGGVVRIK